MSLFKTVFSIPAASFLFTAAVVSAAVASGACSGSSGVTIPTSSTPPGGVTFKGGTFGGSCTGNVYVDAGTGWAFCDAGSWAYTTTDPSTDGYTPLSPSGDGGPGSDSGPGSDGAQGGDSSQGNDGGQGGGSGDGGQGGGSDGGQGHGF